LPRVLLSCPSFCRRLARRPDGSDGFGQAGAHHYVAGIPELVIDGETGLAYFPAGSIDDMRRPMRAWASILPMKKTGQDGTGGANQGVGTARR